MCYLGSLSTMDLKREMVGKDAEGICKSNPNVQSAAANIRSKIQTSRPRHQFIFITMMAISKVNVEWLWRLRTQELSTVGRVGIVGEEREMEVLLQAKVGKYLHTSEKLCCQ